MATTKESRRRKPRRRKARETAKTAVAETRRKKRRRSAKRRTREVVRAKSPARRRRRAAKSYMMAPKRRKRRSRARESWYGQPIRHRKAAKKGIRRAKRRRSRARETVSENLSVASPRRRRRRASKRHYSYETSSRRRSAPRRNGMFESRGGTGYAMELAASVVSGGIGFLLADALDRFLATYDPSAAEKPQDKFTSDGAGTLANTLNIAQSPDILRIAAGVGVTALPALASVYTSQRLLKSTLQGAAIGAGVNLFKTFWNNVVMGSWLKPKDTSTAALQKSFIARLYPAEVAAAINVENNAKQAPAGSGFGYLSGAQQDAGPFALSAYQAPVASHGVGATFTPVEPGPVMETTGPRFVPPMPKDKDCETCNPYLGFIGDAQPATI